MDGIPNDILTVIFTEVNKYDKQGILTLGTVSKQWAIALRKTRGLTIHAADTAVTDGAFKILDGSMLDTVVLSRCTNITDQCLYYIRNAHHIHIDGCYKITDVGIGYLMTVKTLDIRGCHMVTAKSISRLTTLQTLSCPSYITREPITKSDISAEEYHKWLAELKLKPNEEKLYQEFIDFIKSAVKPFTIDVCTAALKLIIPSVILSDKSENHPYLRMWYKAFRNSRMFLIKRRGRTRPYYTGFDTIESLWKKLRIRKGYVLLDSATRNKVDVLTPGSTYIVRSLKRKIEDCPLKPRKNLVS